MKYIEDEIRFGPDGAKLRNEARRVLEAADCLGVFPTPVEQIMAAANVQEMPEEALDEGFLKGLRRRAGKTGKALKRALSKVLGVFDATARLVYVGPVKYPARKLFLRLHETAHGWLNWQRDLYAVVEDCEKTISPDIAERFDAEANLFASEVLFQLDTFTEQVRDEPFGLKAPLKVGKKFKASAYASIRRFVSMHDRACAVVVLNPPELITGHGFKAGVRRVVASQSFLEQFGDIELPKYVTPDDPVGQIVPMGGRRMTGKRMIAFDDLNGVRHDCVAEAFDSTLQVFILICPSRALTRKIITMAG